MRTMLTGLIAVSLAAGIAGQADAATHKKKKRHAAAEYARSDGPRARASRADRANRSDYYEHDPDKVPFGTQLWWRTWDEKNLPW